MEGFNDKDRQNFIDGVMSGLDTKYQEDLIMQRIDAMTKEIEGFTNKYAPVEPAQPSEPSLELEEPKKETPKAEAPKKEEKGGLLDSVGQFFKELPTQAAGGVYDAINNAIKGASDIDTAISDMLGIPKVGLQFYDKEGNFDLQLVSGDEAKELNTDILPNMPKAETAAGDMTRALATFATGFLPASKGLQALGYAAGSATSMAAGAVADSVAFDPHNARLSTLLNEVPVLNTVIPDYLADNNPEHEGEWEGRIKNALEGVVIGGASEKIIGAATKMFKSYKASIRAPKMAKTAQQAISEEVEAGAAKTAAIDEFVEDRAIDLGPEEILAKDPKGNTYLNHNRIKTANDIKNTMQQMADRAIDTGKMSLDDMVEQGSKEYESVKELLGRDINRPFTAAEAVAAREIMTESANQLTKLAKIANGKLATPEDMWKFRRAVEVHGAIQETVLAGRKATARSLKSWSIPTGTSKARATAIADIMQGQGRNAKEMASMITDIAERGGNVSAAVNKGLMQKWKDAHYQVWINGLLSSPATHVANVTSNMATTMFSIPERYITAGFDAMRGAGGTSLIEANARAAGFFGGLQDGWKLMTKGSGNAALLASKVEGKDIGAISAAAWGKQPDSVVGKGLDYIGKAIGMPGWALEKGDMFFKGINYRMRLQEEAAKTALNEGLTGSAFKRRVAELIHNPTDPMKDISTDFARYQTFTNEPGKIAKAATQLRNSSSLGRYVVPFVNTPANILSYGFERTPLAFAMSEIRPALLGKKGGAAAAEAWARLSAGSLLMGSITPLVLDGKITGAGPSNYNELRALKATGWQPYSIKVGDKYISYERMEPISTLIGYSADIGSIMGQLHEEEAGDLVAAGLAAFAKNLTNKSFLSGITDFTNMVTSGQPKSIQRWAEKQLAGVMQPVMSSAGRSANNYFNPTVRDYRGEPEDPFGFLSASFKRAADTIPGFGQDAPPLRDVWGREMKNPEGGAVVRAIETLSPIKIGEDKNDPVSQLVADNKIGLSLPARSIQGVPLTNAEYSKYSEIAGKQAKKVLDELHAAGGFDNMTGGPDGMIANVIKNAVFRARSYARSIMLQESPELYQRLLDHKQEQIQKKIGG